MSTIERAVVLGAVVWFIANTGLWLLDGRVLELLGSWLIIAVLPPVIAVGILWVRRGNRPQ